MKLTLSKLKSLVREELTKADKKKKKKLEKELDKIDHKWMKEGKLSSALMEKYEITKDDAVGKVLWHSLNESGKIGVYDMKFGNTIVRNLLAEDIEPILVQEHDHPPQNRDDD